jgi:hypothetical protein
MAGNPLAGMTVLDEGGEAVAVETLWQEQPIVLAFVRHFG